MVQKRKSAAEVQVERVFREEDRPGEVREEPVWRRLAELLVQSGDPA